MRCDICKCEDSIVKDYEHVFTIKGKEIKFTSKRRFCKSCGSLVYDSILDNEASEIAIDLYNKKYGIPKEELINLRNSFNLSQELFAKVIGCAKKTLISYEKGSSIPNDSYLIIIKSLMAKPESIFFLIEANKDLFTSREYERIRIKLDKMLLEKVNNFEFKDEMELSVYNGYANYSKEKINNIILFFAEKSILKTKLLKEMFYTDFLTYKSTCKSITGISYARLPFGPVPDQFDSILYYCVLNDFIDYNVEIYNKDYERHIITSLRKFDKSLFTKDELAIMKKVRDKFKNFTASEIVEYSHKEKAFKETKANEKISYDYAFDIDFK